jgi:hypothetical protein
MKKPLIIVKKYVSKAVAVRRDTGEHNYSNARVFLSLLEDGSEWIVNLEVKVVGCGVDKIRYYLVE